MHFTSFLAPPWNNFLCTIFTFTSPAADTNISNLVSPIISPRAPNGQPTLICDSRPPQLYTDFPSIEGCCRVQWGLEAIYPWRHPACPKQTSFSEHGNATFWRFTGTELSDIVRNIWVNVTPSTVRFENKSLPGFQP